MTPLQLTPDQIVREATVEELKSRLTQAELASVRARGGTVLIADDGRMVIDPGRGRPEMPIATSSPLLPRKADTTVKGAKSGRRAKVDLRA